MSPPRTPRLSDLAVVVPEAPSGDLSDHIEEWRSLSEYLASVLEGGVRIEWVHELPEPLDLGEHVPRAGSLEEEAIRDKVSELYHAKKIMEAELKFFVTRLFTLPKKVGNSRRLIHNLKPLNLYCLSKKFKMEGLKEVRVLLREGDYMTKIDIKSAFYHIPLHPKVRKYFQFRFQGRVYQWRFLPMGWNGSPMWFARFTRAMAKRLRAEGIRVIYVDDLWLTAESYEKALKNTQFAVDLMNRLGFIMAMEKGKSDLVPKQVITFLGTIIDSVKMEFRVPKGKIVKYKKKIERLLSRAGLKKPVRLQDLQSITGQIMAMSEAFVGVQIHLRGIYQLLKTLDLCGKGPGNHAWSSFKKARKRKKSALPSQNWITCAKNTSRKVFSAKNTSRNVFPQETQSEPAIFLDEPALADLKWWVNHLDTWNGRSLLAPAKPDHVFSTDSSGYAWGAFMHDPPARTHGFFRTEERKLHITGKELLAILFGLKSFGKKFHWQNLSLLVKTDNLCALSYVNNYGGSIKLLCGMAKKIFDFCEERNITIKAEYLPGELNYLADFESRRKPEAEDRMLARRWFRKLAQVLGPLGTDCFASRQNAQLERFIAWRPDPDSWRTDFFAQALESIPEPYGNPPFSMIGRVLRKLLEGRKAMTLVIPVWPSRPWWPLVQELLIEWPLLLPKTKDLFVPPHGLRKMDQQAPKWNVIGVRLSGSNSAQRAFRARSLRMPYRSGRRMSETAAVQLLCQRITAFGSNGWSWQERVDLTQALFRRWISPKASASPSGRAGR